MIRPGTLALLAVMSVAIGTSAQQPKPLAANFSGTWALTSDKNPTGAPVGRVLEIVQKGQTLTLTGGREGDVTYKLDGSETTWQTKTVNSDIWRKSARVQVVTNALVITTHTDAGATGRWDDLMVLSLDHEGHLNLVSSNATIYQQPVMATGLFIYDKKAER